jgi:hypothetical protein
MLFLAGCVLLTFSGGRPAKSSPAGQASGFNVEGKINTLGQNKLTLNSEENMIFHVTYDEKTEFKSDDGSPASSKDLQVGLRIRVAGDFTESGEIAAQKIEVLKAPPKK